MATKTILVCDHCGVDDSSSGVGEGNVRKVHVVFTNADLDDIDGTPDLCVDCCKEMHDEIMRCAISSAFVKIKRRKVEQ